MRKVFVSLIFIALAIALPAGAQLAPKSLDQVIVVKPKPSMSAQWETGLKKLNDWARAHNLLIAHYCWSIISGPRTGQYVIASPGHDWKDFDAAAQASHGVRAQILADVDPYTESHLTSYWEFRAKLSSPPPAAGQTPLRFIDISTYFLKPGGAPAVTDAIKAANAAIAKSHWPAKPSSWWTLVNGGNGSEMAFVTGHANWADFQPPETSFGKVLNEVYGHEGATALYKKFFSALRSWRSEIWTYRADLSYIPASH